MSRSRTVHGGGKDGHGGGRPLEAPADRGPIRLDCGHYVAGAPTLSNPARWWHCGAWRKRKK